MPRFHFNTDDRRDVDGREFATVADAKCEAIRMFGTIICSEADTFWDRAEWCMTITDDRGLTLFQLQIIGTESAAIRNPRMPLRA